MSTKFSLPSGREVVLDLANISIREFRSLFDQGQAQDEEDALIAKVAGLTVEELQSLSYPDYRALAKKFFEAARDPLSDPN
jgi:hypothetical protein